MPNQQHTLDPIEHSGSIDSIDSIDPIDQITERVELLLLRYAQLQHANALLGEQVSTLTHERDSLRSRLSAARARVGALIERLPESIEPIPLTPVDPVR